MSARVTIARTRLAMISRDTCKSDAKHATSTRSWFVQLGRYGYFAAQSQTPFMPPERLQGLPACVLSTTGWARAVTARGASAACRGLLCPLERSDLGLELGQVLAGSPQHLGLHVELLTRNQVEATQEARHHCAHVFLDVLRRRAGEKVFHPCSELIE